MCDEDLVKQPNYLLSKCQGETRRTVFISPKHYKAETSRPTSESSSKELNLSSKLNQTWTRPDLDLN